MGLIRHQSTETEKPTAEKPALAVPKGLNHSVEKNKIQLRERMLLYPGGRESKRKEQQEQLECRAGSETAASGHGELLGAAPFPSPSAQPAHPAAAEAQHCIRSLGTNTAAAQTSLSGPCTTLQGSQEGSLPVSSRGWSRAADVPSPHTSCCVSVLTQPSPTAARSATPSERGEHPLQPFQQMHPKQPRAVQGQKLGEVMLPVEVLQLLG